jgi:hypothetical protein
MSLSAAVVGVLLTFAAPEAGDAQGVEDQIDTRNKAAIAAYEDGDFKKMKAQVTKAIAVGEQGGGGTAALARAYVLAGVLQVDGLENKDAGVKLFVKALKIAPDIQIPPGMGTTPVKLAFKQARGQVGGPPPEAAPAEPPREAKAERAPPPKEARETKESKDKEEEFSPEAELEKSKPAPPPAEGKRESGGSRSEKQLREANLNLTQDLAMARKAESKERFEKESRERELTDAKQRLALLEKDKPDRERQLARLQQLEKDKADRDKQLTDTKGRLALLEKDKPEKDRQLADARTRIQQLEKDKADRDKQLADLGADDKRQREAKEKLEKEKVERDKALADTKARLAQVEKDKADTEKKLAATADREKKEREAKEAAEHERQFLEVGERDKKSREDKARAERDKMIEGPDLPARIPEPLYCTVPDEVEAGADLYVHCVPQGSVRAKIVAFYYRPTGVAHYNSVVMDRSKKGWYGTVVPGGKVAGKLLQYYAEARDGADAVLATNGKASSPNVVTLLPPGKPQATAGKRAR